MTDFDAAWKEAQFGVSQVRPDFLSLTQSQYGWSAFTDGYYFNVVRSLPITSGHGGYHDFGLGTFNPSYFLEMARARDYWKPCWYLPTWYGNTTPDQFRLEQIADHGVNQTQAGRWRKAKKPFTTRIAPILRGGGGKNPLP